MSQHEVHHFLVCRLALRSQSGPAQIPQDFLLRIFGWLRTELSSDSGIVHRIYQPMESRALVAVTVAARIEVVAATALQFASTVRARQSRHRVLSFAFCVCRILPLHALLP